MIKKTTILLCLLICVRLFVAAQPQDFKFFEIEKQADRIYPSKYLIPYIKYIENRPGLASGVPDITADMDLGLKLIYNASGIMINEESSYVGLGWFSNIGGIVTRVIKDQPDENQITGYIDYSGKEYSSSGIASFSNSDTYTFSSIPDKEQDMFYFYTKDFMGKFVIDRGGKIRTIPKSNIDIEIKRNDTNGDITEIRITPPGGNIYFFGKGETARMVAMDGRAVTTGWTLNAILSHKNDAVIALYSYAKALSSLNYKYGKYSYSERMGNRVVKDPEVMLYYESVVMPYTLNTGDINVKVKYKNHVIPDKEVMKLRFSYKDGDSRTQTFGDAVIDSVYINRGLLSSRYSFKTVKIEPDLNREHAKPVYFLKSMTSGRGGEDCNLVMQTINFEYTNMPSSSPVNPIVVGEDLWGYPCRNSDNEVLTEASLTGNYLNPFDNSAVVAEGASILTDPLVVTYRMLNRISIEETGNITDYIFEPNNFMYKGRAITGGGVRIKEKQLYNSSDESKKFITRYSYTRPGTTTSSGILTVFPYVGEKVTDNTFAGSNIVQYGEYHYGLHSEDIRPVYYSDVTVETPGAGKIGYRFAVQPASTPDVSNNIRLYNNKLHSVVNVNSINRAGIQYRYSNDYLKPVGVTKMKGDGTVISRSVNSYSAVGTTESNTGFRKRFTLNWKHPYFVNNPSGGIEPIEDCYGAITQISYYDNISSSYPIKKISESIIKDGNTVTTSTSYDYLTTGKNLPYKKSVLMADGTQQVEETYFTGSYVGGKPEKYKADRELMYRELDKIPASNIYFDNTEGTWKMNKEYGIPNTHKEYYEWLSLGVNTVNTREIYEMQLRNNIYAPVETINYTVLPSSDTILISSRVNVYEMFENNGIGVGKVYELRGPVRLTGDLYNRSCITSSDHFVFQDDNMRVTNEVLRRSTYGSVLEQRGEDGVITSLYYDSDFNVIAKGVGVDFSTLTQDKELKAKLEKDEYPFKNYEGYITTYRYKKYFGKVSETDVRGRFTYYGFNALGEVVSVYDNDKNIVSAKRRFYNGKPIPEVYGPNPLIGASFDKQATYYRDYDYRRKLKVDKGITVSCNGKTYTDDFYFPAKGKYIVDYYTLQQGKLIKSEQIGYNVESRPFKPRIEVWKKVVDVYGKIRYKEDYDSDKTKVYDVAFDNPGSLEMSIYLDKNGGSGHYRIKVAYVKYKEGNDMNNLSPTYLMKDIEWSENMKPYKHMIDHEGHYELYVWIYDRKSTAADELQNTKPELSTAHYTYKFDIIRRNAVPLPTL